MDSPILGEGFRIKTRKLKGEISQGLVLPVTDFKELDYLMLDDTRMGEDVTELLGVKKFEIEERATTGGTIIGQLPYGVPHTDEIRIQADPELLEDFRGKKYYITTKMDGSSHSLCIDENGFHVCGHNYEYKDDGLSSFYEFVKKRKLKEKMEAYMEKNGYKTLTVQGEFCAPGIQKNKLKLQAPEWFIFTVIVNGYRVGLNNTILASSALGGVMVPFEEIGDDLTAKYPTVDALLARADGTYPNGGAKEGIVIRTTFPEWDKRIGAYLSMKVINNKYLLKEKD
jgi:RNA ligase (TIGR02306 family)